MMHTATTINPTPLRRRREEDFSDGAIGETPSAQKTEETNIKYRGMKDEDVKRHMKWVVYLWSATQLFGSFAMPAWIAVFATQWYTAVNLVPGEVALIVTFSKCIDVLTDPMMACYLRKCTMHTIGKIAVLGSVIQAIAFIFIFIPFKPIDPALGRDRVLLQYAIAYVVFFIGDTLTGTPTTTLGTMLKSQRILDEAHHNDGLRIGSMMKVVGILVMGFVTLIVGTIMDATDNEMGPEDGVMAGLKPVTNLVCAILFGIIHIVINVAFVGVLNGYKNSTISPALQAALRKSTFLQQFSEMLTSSYNNPYFRQLIGAWMCDQLTVTLMKNLLMWFVRHKVEPEMAKGCAAYEDPINAKYIDDEGFESGYPKSSFECKASNVAVIGVFFVIVGAIVGNVFWQKKLEREKDRYGNRNVYRNWLLFNLSSAVTNGLMVFVGRGDNRLFWFLCFINGLPIGGEFMTDTILLFLIASETWLSRTDEPLTLAEESEQLDAHTTKFSMMKTFIPKAVSLIAEAMPLALIQIWYREPREICKDAIPVIPDINSVECANYLSYNGTGNPKYIPQKPQVSELISFFFFILPTLTCLLSYYIKSKFQVTDSGELVMLNNLKKGVPDIDGRPASMSSYSIGNQQVAERSGLDQHSRTKIQKSLTEFNQKMTRTQDCDREAVESLVFQLQDACSERVQGEISKVQNLASIVLPKYISDEWLGTLVPTTHGQHLFRLPYLVHPLTRVPISVLKFAMEEFPEANIPPWVAHTVLDGRSVSAVKGLIHGVFSIVILPITLLVSGVSLAVSGMVYFVRRCIPGFREKCVPVQGKSLMLFGVLGRRSLSTFTEKILPAVATHVIAPDCPERADDVLHTVLEWLHEERANSDTALQHREKRLTHPEHESVTFSDRKLYIEDRIISRLVYLKTFGYSLMSSMLLIIIIVFASQGSSIIKGKWSIVITVPLFISAMGLVLALYFHGLHTLSYKDEDGERVFCSERALDSEGLVALTVTHYNTFNSAGGHPLVFSDRSGGGKDTLLGGIRNTPIVLSGAPGFSRDTNSLAFLTLVPAKAMGQTLKQLAPIHRTLDAVQAEANRSRVEKGYAANVRWGVCNIAPARAYPQYKCLLYFWEGVSAPAPAPSSGGMDRKKID